MFETETEEQRLRDRRTETETQKNRETEEQRDRETEEQRQERRRMLINCSHCRSPLVLPPAAQSLRCTLCNAITMVASPSPPPPYQHRHNDMYSSSSVPSSLVPLPLNAHGSKKALICGVSYRHSQHELKGCLNDAKCMKFLLTRKFNFPESSILLLTGNECLQKKFIVPLFFFLCASVVFLMSSP